MKRFMQRVGVLAALTLATLILLLAASKAALALTLSVLAASILALFTPLPRLGLGSRVFSAVLLIMIGVPGSLLAWALVQGEQAQAFALLRTADPDAYLTQLHERDPDRWFEELAALDPARHEEEVKRREEEAERIAAHRAAEAEREAAERAAEAEAERIAEEAERRAEDEAARIAAEEAAAEAYRQQMADDRARRDELLQQQITARAEAERRRSGQHCLSSWDSSHREFAAYVRSQMRNPDSFEVVETRMTPVDESKTHTLFMTYRAENGFGGMNVGTAVALVSNASCQATPLAIE